MFDFKQFLILPKKNATIPYIFIPSTSRQRKSKLQVTYDVKFTRQRKNAKMVSRYQRWHLEKSFGQYTSSLFSEIPVKVSLQLPLTRHNNAYLIWVRFILTVKGFTFILTIVNAMLTIQNLKTVKNIAFYENVRISTTALPRKKLPKPFRYFRSLIMPMHIKKIIKIFRRFGEGLKLN